MSRKKHTQAEWEQAIWNAAMPATELLWTPTGHVVSQLWVFAPSQMIWGLGKPLLTQIEAIFKGFSEANEPLKPIVRKTVNELVNRKLIVIKPAPRAYIQGTFDFTFTESSGRLELSLHAGDSRQGGEQVAGVRGE